MFEIKSKCATVNWQKSTKFTKRMPNKIGCDVSVKQMFRTWMKTLLHCGFGQTQVNQITYEPIHSAQAQSVSHGKNIFWVRWSPLLRHFKK